MPLPALVGLLLLWQGAASSLDVLVVDRSNRPVPGVRVELKTGGTVAASAQTGEDGHAEFHELKPARYELDVSKDGFEPVQKADLELPASVELTLTPAPARKESIEVKGTVVALEQGASAPNEIPAQPVSAYNLTDHFNPGAFHNNVADPAFGLFFGQRGLRFTADFDVIF